MAILLQRNPTSVDSAHSDPFLLTAREDPLAIASTSIQHAITKAHTYLHKNAKKHKSITNTNVIIEENFAQFLIMEVTETPSLVEVERSERLYNFFKGHGQLTTNKFPCDLDTTSIGVTVLGAESTDKLNSILDEMLLYRNENGILKVYFDRERPRIDPVACLNMLALFHKAGRGTEVQQTLSYAYQVLISRDYITGTRYYHSAECFIYFATRFVTFCGSQSIRKKWLPLLRARLMELRFGGKSNDPLATAMRILCASDLEVHPDPEDVSHLIKNQNENGCWEGGWFYKYGSSGVLIENLGLTTAFAMKALKTLM